MVYGEAVGECRNLINNFISIYFFVIGLEERATLETFTFRWSTTTPRRRDDSAVVTSARASYQGGGGGLGFHYGTFSISAAAYM